MRKKHTKKKETDSDPPFTFTEVGIKAESLRQQLKVAEQLEKLQLAAAQVCVPVEKKKKKKHHSPAREPASASANMG